MRYPSDVLNGEKTNAIQSCHPMEGRLSGYLAFQREGEDAGRGSSSAAKNEGVPYLGSVRRCVLTCNRVVPDVRHFQLRSFQVVG